MGTVGTVKIQIFKEDDAGETGRNPRFHLPKEKITVLPERVQAGNGKKEREKRLPY